METKLNIGKTSSFRIVYVLETSATLWVDLGKTQNIKVVDLKKLWNFGKNIVENQGR